MPKIFFQTTVFLLAGLVLVSGAHADVVSVADRSIEYDDTVSVDADENGFAELTSYYNDGALVLSVYDNDEDGTPDLWLVFGDGWYVELEAGDADGDGEPDAFFELDREGNVLNQYGEEIERLFVETSREDIIGEAAEEEDLVGSLDDIGPGSGVGLKLLLFFIIGAIGAGGYWFYKNKMAR